MKILRNTRKLSGFTLVELIVVITILVILGTIAFISLGGYSLSARDSTRISNLNNLHKGLAVFQIKAGTYPMPEGPITLTASGPIIGYQGFAKELTESIAKLSPGATKDPLDPTIYTTYSVNTNQTKIQLMNFLENGSTATAYTNGIPNLSNIQNPLITQASASNTSDYSKRTPSTKGNTLGILLGSTGTTLNQPVQESYNVSSFTGVDVVNTATGYSVVISQTKTIIGSGASLKILTANNPKNSATYALSCKDIFDNGLSLGDGTYYINPTGAGSFETYCDMTNGGWTRIVYLTDGGGVTFNNLGKGIKFTRIRAVKATNHNVYLQATYATAQTANTSFSAIPQEANTYVYLGWAGGFGIYQNTAGVCNWSGPTVNIIGATWNGTTCGSVIALVVGQNTLSTIRTTAYNVEIYVTN